MRTWMVFLAFATSLASAAQAQHPAETPQLPAAAAQPPAAAPDATPATPVPPTPEPTAPPETAPPAIPPAPPPPACVPSCRTGFTCVGGRCVSSCNPPCNLGDYCTAAGECLRRPITPLPGDPAAARAGLGYHTHDGFFLRVTGGVGGGAVSLDIPDTDEQTYTGGGPSMSVDIGGAPVRDLVIFGRLRGAWLLDPALRVDGEKIADTDGLAVNQGLLGVGLNYYLMPINLYFGGVIGFAVVETVQRRRNRDDRTDTSDVGFGLDLDVGKEWWIDDNWGIGVALRLSLSAVPAEDLANDAMFGSGFLGVLFSATYQ